MSDNEVFSTLLKYEQQLKQFAPCGFEVVNRMTAKSTIFREVIARGLVEMCRRFGTTLLLFLCSKGKGAKQPVRKQHSFRYHAGQYKILSRVWVAKAGFILVIEFINHSQIVTTINYHIVPDFHTTNHSTLSLS
jgi:hypothetical protein